MIEPTDTISIAPNVDVLVERWFGAIRIEYRVDGEEVQSIMLGDKTAMKCAISILTMLDDDIYKVLNATPR